MEFKSRGIIRSPSFTACASQLSSTFIAWFIKTKQGGALTTARKVICVLSNPPHANMHTEDYVYIHIHVRTHTHTFILFLKKRERKVTWSQE